MPIHDWTKTYDGVVHSFHGTWLFDLARVLNGGLLPQGYYALGEQVIGGAVPDVLTLETPGSIQAPALPSSAWGASAATLPAATIHSVAETPKYPPRPRVIAVRHRSGNQLVSMIEIVSAGNKKDAAEIGAFVDKTVVALSKRVHVLLIDLHPPGSLDPQGIHNLIWTELGQEPTPLPPDHPLLCASYLSHGPVESFLEPRAVGESLPDMPLFLSRGLHVQVPLELTYTAAFAGLPAHLRREIEQ